ncbi:MAG: hypothetical protein WC216_02950 [Gallionella sp.]|jgi:hypothetical protein
MNPRYVKGAIALLAGTTINFLGDWLLGVKIEIFTGIATFTFPWMLDIFLVPFISGLAVAKIFGKGSKWLACIPPLIVRSTSYLYLYLSDPQGDFFFKLHLHYWGLCVILAVESANIAGILGEVLMGVYRRKPDATDQTDLAPEAQKT